MSRMFSNSLRALCAALLLIASPALAQERIIGGGVFGPIATTTYVGPGDQTSFTAWYSVARAYSAAYALSQGLAFNAENGSQTVNCDFPVTTAGAIGLSKNCSVGISNGQTMTVFCGVGCTITELYDQTGGGRHLLQGTLANQPALTISCVNSLPCAVTSATTTTIVSASNFTPATGVLTIAAMAERVSGTGNYVLEQNGTGGNRLRSTNGTANQWGSANSGGTIVATANDAVAHAFVGVFNGASSVLAVDGTETTGTNGANTTAGAIGTSLGVGSTTGEMSEFGFTDNVAFSPTVRTNLCHNLRLAYATSGTC